MKKQRVRIGLVGLMLAAAGLPGLLQAGNLVVTQDGGQLVYCSLDNLVLSATGDVTAVCASAGGNKTPVAINDSATVETGKSVTISVLANDNQGDGPATVVSLTQPLHGSATLSGANAVLYAANAGFSGADSFRYTIEDVDGEQSSATVSLTVTPEPTASGCQDTQTIKCLELPWPGNGLNATQFVTIPAGVTHVYHFKPDANKVSGTIGFDQTSLGAATAKLASMSTVPGNVSEPYPCGPSRGASVNGGIYYAPPGTSSRYCDAEQGKDYYFSIKSATNESGAYVLVVK